MGAVAIRSSHSGASISSLLEDGSTAGRPTSMPIPRSVARRSSHSSPSSGSSGITWPSSIDTSDNISIAAGSSVVRSSGEVINSSSSTPCLAANPSSHPNTSSSSTSSSVIISAGYSGPPLGTITSGSSSGVGMATSDAASSTMSVGVETGISFSSSVTRESGIVTNSSSSVAANSSNHSGVSPVGIGCSAVDATAGSAMPVSHSGAS